MSQKVSIDQMDDAIMECLEKYAKVSTDDMKTAVKKTAKRKLLDGHRNECRAA